MSNASDFEEDLRGLQHFRDWLESLVAAQQPIEEWSLSLEDLRQRWLPQFESRVTTEAQSPVTADVRSSRLFF